MHLIDLLAPSRVHADARATSKKRLLELAAAALVQPGDSPELERRIYDSLCLRERLGSTGLGHGVAIPHGRIAGLTAPAGAFLKLTDALPFDASDGQPVDLVFALVVPEHLTQQHLMLLSQLAQMFSDADFCSQLRHAGNDSELYSALSDWQIAHLAA
ncbi:PTS sugar transporter subunit IIA [Xanthomonadaceae bacterium XH05]|nr:PTS sugar transporter subunit IIA [Xanthomonadaceae bacterium XH05]